MTKFMSLEFLGLSHGIPGKIENAVYRLEISSLVPEIFKLQKCVKYANERIDDVIHSTQYNIKYINRPISINLQQRTLKLRPRLHGEKLSRVKGSPSYPSYPGRANFSSVSLQNLTNCLHEKQKLARLEG